MYGEKETPDSVAGTDFGVGLAQESRLLEIRVPNNGTGIPEAIRDKIFQQFFTTKPTGKGTGLAYDIVLKGHGDAGGRKYRRFLNNVYAKISV